MYQIKVDKSTYEKYDTKTVIVKRDGDFMIAIANGLEILRVDLPDELKDSFDLVPIKRGYFKKSEEGDIFFTLIRYLDYHLHSTYSLLDGANKIATIVKKSEGCSAITDHGVMFGVVDFFKAMDKACKKSIVGIEVYCESKDGDKDANHMILLVKNQQGWKNVCKIISVTVIQN